jgi:hypothetical protein
VVTRQLWQRDRRGRSRTGRPLPLEMRGRDELLHQFRSQPGLVVLVGIGRVSNSTVAAELARLEQPERLVW